MGKKVTFKQRQKTSSMKAKQNIKHNLRKQVGGRSRNQNRSDDREDILSGRTMLELVTDVNAGSAVGVQETMDARSLADLLAKPMDVQVANIKANPQTKEKRTHVGIGVPNKPEEAPKVIVKNQLAATAMAQDDVNALPHVPVIPEDVQFFRDQEAAREEQARASGNRYKKRGQPHAFWEGHKLAAPILKSLREMKFTHPTPIQEDTIPFAITESATKDMVVSAETGSGKTLVFAIPVLHHVLTDRPDLLEPRTQASGDRAVGKKNKREKEDVGAGKLNEDAPEEEIEEEEEEEEAAEDEEDIDFDELDDEEEEDEEYEEDPSDLEEVTDEEDEDDEEEFEEEEEAKLAPGHTAKTEKRVDPKFQAKVMHTLIVSPTRELALQINDAFKQLAAHCSVTIGCIVGGMAPAKQQRVLNRHPDILICTPGRLWELVQANEGCYLGHSISRRLKYVVLDEADKLLESNRFDELKNILERIHAEYLPAGEHVELDGDGEVVGGDGDGKGLCEGTWDEANQKFVPTNRENPLHQAAKGIILGAKDRPRPVPMPPAPGRKHRVVTFVTSATLSLQTKYERKDIKKKFVITTKQTNVIRSVLNELSIKQKNCKLFDFNEGGANVVKNINETYLRCPEDSKDLYLYYFLRHYKERAVIFVNAISMLRRLTKFLEILGINVCALHASMQQRQRLKFIDKFKRGEKQVLIATDIASRGLDIDGLKYVIHYQVARSTDAYIHRCGRTARCGGTGLSVMLVNPSEYVSYKKLLASLGRKQAMEVFSCDPAAVHQLHPHLKLAMHIDKLQLQVEKSKASQRWVRTKQEEAEVDPGDLVDRDAEQENREKLKAIKVFKRQMEQMVRKDVAVGGRGAYRTAAKQLGVQQAGEKLRERAQRQALYSDTAHKQSKK